MHISAVIAHSVNARSGVILFEKAKDMQLDVAVILPGRNDVLIIPIFPVASYPILK